MTKLFFIRHGKTKWNLEGRYQGARGDSPLLEQSYHEIELLAAYLQKYQFAKIYSSPLKRALTTAKQLAKKLDQPVKIEVDQAFCEFNLGKMEGMKFIEVERLYPEIVDAFRNHPEKYDPTEIEGETFQELFERMTPKIEEICRRYPTQNILIVSHGAALCAEIRHLQGVSLEKLRAKGGLVNTSTTILETKDGQSFKCLAWNQTDYLNKQLDSSDMV